MIKKNNNSSRKLHKKKIKDLRIKNLENNPEYIEKIARELFYMAKKDEKIYRVEQEKTIK